MQHDARARIARRRQRAPAERRLDVVRVHDARAGAPHRRGHLVRREAAAQQPERRPAAPERRRVALQDLDLLAELGRGSATRGPRPLAPPRRERGSGCAAAGSRDADPAPAPGRGELPARGRGRRGRALPRRPPIRHARAAPTAHRLAGAVTVRVAVVAEYYPRAADPVLGVWAHRQALAARDAGAEVRVLVLHRPLPSRAALRSRDPRALVAPLRQPLRTRARRAARRLRPVPRAAAAAQLRLVGRLGGAVARARPAPAAARVPVRPRPRPLRRARRRRRAPRARRRAGRRLRARRRRAVARGSARAPAPRRCAPGSAHAGIVLANSRRDRAALPRARGAADRGRAPRHRPAGAVAERRGATLVTVGHLVARKRHGDVLRALWLLRDSHPEVRYEVVGDGPERGALERLAGELGLDGRVRFRGQLPPAAAARGGAGRRRVRAAERRRGVRRRLRRGDGRRRARDRLPRRAGPGGDRGGRRRPAARRARRPGGARGGAAHAARRAGRGAASSATPRARPSRPRSRGSSCGRATVAAYEAALR